MILTYEEAKRLHDDYMSDPFELIREIKKTILEKLCAGVSMPEAMLDTFVSGKLYTADQLRAYGASCRLRALEDAALVCDGFDTGRKLATDYKAAEMATAIRTLKGGA